MGNGTWVCVRGSELNIVQDGRVKKRTARRRRKKQKKAEDLGKENPIALRWRFRREMEMLNALAVRWEVQTSMGIQ